MTALLALLVVVFFGAWLYLYESARLDERERRSRQEWVERYHRGR